MSYGGNVDGHLPPPVSRGLRVWVTREPGPRKLGGKGEGASLWPYGASGLVLPHPQTLVFWHRPSSCLGLPSPWWDSPGARHCGYKTVSGARGHPRGMGRGPGRKTSQTRWLCTRLRACKRVVQLAGGVWRGWICVDSSMTLALAFLSLIGGLGSRAGLQTQVLSTTSTAFYHQTGVLFVCV